MVIGRQGTSREGEDTHGSEEDCKGRDAEG